MRGGDSLGSPPRSAKKGGTSLADGFKDDLKGETSIFSGLFEFFFPLIRQALLEVQHVIAATCTKMGQLHKLEIPW